MALGNIQYRIDGAFILGRTAASPSQQKMFAGYHTTPGSSLELQLGILNIMFFGFRVYGLGFRSSGLSPKQS